MGISSGSHKCLHILCSQIKYGGVYYTCDVNRFLFCELTIPMWVKKLAVLPISCIDILSVLGIGFVETGFAEEDTLTSKGRNFLTVC